MRAFAGGYYNNLKALYDYLGVQYRSQPFLFEFGESNWGRNGRSHASYFVHASNLHRLAPRPRSVGLRLYLAELVYLIACYAWFSVCCFLIAPRREETLQQYLQRVKVPQRFVAYYLLPLMSSVTTCPHKSLLAFPAVDLAALAWLNNSGAGLRARALFYTHPWPGPALPVGPCKGASRRARLQLAFERNAADVEASRIQAQD